MVIVIIALIVVGVVGGQDLVKQAKLRQIITDVQNIKIAFNAFKLEYDSLPGDMINANDYWSGCNSGSTARDCNGNGNRIINWNDSPGICPSSQEPLRFWQHLSNAKLITSGSYSGVCSPDGYS